MLLCEQDKERESSKTSQGGTWGMLLTHLPQVAIVEKSYVDLGFLLTKNKGFLRKDVSTETNFLYVFYFRSCV